jgi:threonine/homoserine/homoserine lactone efflux protein
LAGVMNGAIGEILPLALAVAVSPIPIITAILLLLAPGVRAKAIAFFLGWTGGITIAVVVFALLSGLLGSEKDGSSPIVGTIKILLGVLLLLVAFRQWRRRSRPGQEPTMPKWMSAIDKMTVTKSVALGLILSGLNPKNLMMAISAGTTIGTAGLTFGGATLTIVIFVVIAISSVGVPVVAYLVAADRMTAPLQSLRVWLIRNNTVILTILLLVLGVVNIGKGITAL